MCRKAIRFFLAIALFLAGCACNKQERRQPITFKFDPPTESLCVTEDTDGVSRTLREITIQEVGGHANIRIPFEANGRKYEAVGFIRDGERCVSGDEMLARTMRDAGEKDSTYPEWVSGVNSAKELAGFKLVAANVRRIENQRIVTYLYWNNFSQSWEEDWFWLKYQWDASFLMVRRATE